MKHGEVMCSEYMDLHASMHTLCSCSVAPEKSLSSNLQFHTKRNKYPVIRILLLNLNCDYILPVSSILYFLDDATCAGANSSVIIAGH